MSNSMRSPSRSPFKPALQSALRSPFEGGGGAAAPAVGSSILLETGDVLLLETGDELLLES
jgi:hypothetical protein